MLFDAPVAPTTSYRVLARAYRPLSFSDLIGQAHLVESLTKALSQGRLPHAFIFTGIRGVGKTTTARILARCLNCDQGPTITPCGVCPSCKAISEDRHLDVIEIDAASRTGVDDMRELIEAGRYKAVMGRYKIFIIDEVHMLSKSAFNALLKTLEEPPPHLIFIFATTEIEKVPATILSRCMRGGLKRIDLATLSAHFQSVAAQEGKPLDDEAAQLLARAADGSVRDGLSLLDQAITLSADRIDAETIVSMLGLVDKASILDWVAAILAKDIPQTLKMVRHYHHLGADCHTLLEDVLEAFYVVTLAKLNQTPEDLPSYALCAQEAITALSQHELAHLMIAWQHLMLALSEVEEAPQPLLALEMALIRLISALPGEGRQLTSVTPGGSPSDQRTPAHEEKKPEPQPRAKEVHGTLAHAETAAAPQAPEVLTLTSEPEAPSTPTVAVAEAPSPTDDPTGITYIVDLLSAHKEPLLLQSVRRDVKPVALAGTSWTIELTATAPAQLSQKLSQTLSNITGQDWHVKTVTQGGADTLDVQEAHEKKRLQGELLTHPLTQAAIDAFPGAVVKIDTMMNETNRTRTA